MWSDLRASVSNRAAALCGLADDRLTPEEKWRDVIGQSSDGWKGTNGLLSCFNRRWAATLRAGPLAQKCVGLLAKYPVYQITSPALSVLFLLCLNFKVFIKFRFFGGGSVSYRNYCYKDDCEQYSINCLANKYWVVLKWVCQMFDSVTLWSKFL